ALLAELKVLGVDFDAPLPAYPLPVGEEVIKRVAAALYAELPEPQRWERMGEDWLDGFLQTMLGRAALAMGRAIGPRRTLERMARNFKTASNYLSSEAVVHGPTDVELRTFVAEPFLPACANRPSVLLYYRAGILRGVLKAFEVKQPDVTIADWNAATQTGRYRVKWVE
ncbi:MAG: DUF2378 family protein, partial [Myxococcales bacterium]